MIDSNIELTSRLPSGRAIRALGPLLWCQQASVQVPPGQGGVLCRSARRRHGCSVHDRSRQCDVPTAGFFRPSSCRGDILFAVGVAALSWWPVRLWPWLHAVFGIVAMLASFGGDKHACFASFIRLWTSWPCQHSAAGGASITCKMRRHHISWSSCTCCPLTCDNT